MTEDDAPAPPALPDVPSGDPPRAAASASDEAVPVAADDDAASSVAAPPGPPPPAPTTMKVTLLSGFLGAGKTTLLQRILRTNDARDEGDRLRMAVIVNDMGEINLDAEEVRSTKLVREDAEMVELHNGCICCTLRGDLLRTVRELSEEGRFDCLVIESTGIGEPLPVAQTFTMDVDDMLMGGPGELVPGSPPGRSSPDDDEGGPRAASDGRRSLHHYATLDTLVTVVDGLNMYGVLGSIETLADENNVSGMLGNTGASKAGETDGAPSPCEDDGGEPVPPPFLPVLLAIALPFAAVLAAASMMLRADQSCSGAGLLGASSLCTLSSLGIAVGTAVAASSLATLIFHGMDSECLFTPWAVEADKALASLEAIMKSWSMSQERGQVIANMMTMDEEVVKQLLIKRKASAVGTKKELCERLDDAFKKAREADLAAQAEDDRPISQLWLDQIEFANVIIVSKAAKLGEDKIGEIEALFSKLNPRARVVVPREDKYGDLDIFATILNTGLFDMEESQQSEAWQLELAKEHNPETEEYGISSMVYTADHAPFHPVRLFGIMQGFGDYSSAIEEKPAQSDRQEDGPEAEEPAPNANPEGVFRGVVRTKGKVWLANANAFPMKFQTAGAHIDIDPSPQPFLHEVVQRLEKDPDDGSFSSEFRKTMGDRKEAMEEKGAWTEKYGDRRSQLIFIGVGLDREGMKRALDGALITEEETEKMGGWQGWKYIEDPIWDGVLPKHHFSWKG